MPHFPGYRYCGPGTDIKKSDQQGGPVNKLDAICRQHDVDLESDSGVSQELADAKFVASAPETGYLGYAFSSAVKLNSLFRQVPLLGQFAPGSKQSAAQPERTPHKRPIPDSGQETPNKYLAAAPQLHEQSRALQFGKRGGDTPNAKMQASQGPAEPEKAPEKTGGSGGGGQVPPMNPRPIQTGTVILHYSRTFRHYINYEKPDYASTFNQGWSHIPYEHICYALKPRDWQTINVMSKRWRVLSCGFNMEHIIPIWNTTTTAGGAVQPTIAFNLMPYLETYIDKGYQLPIINIYSGGDTLPNVGAQENSGNQQTGALKIMKVQTAPGYSSQIQQNQYQNAYNKTYPCALDLMNSSEWGTCLPSQTFSFEWKASPEDLKWRHATMPSDAHVNFGDNYVAATPYGRWDGGFYPTTSEEHMNETNTSFKDGIKRNAGKPSPSCLVRPAIFHDIKGNDIPINFQVLVKYHATIECDVNDIGHKPLFSSAFTTTDQAIILPNEAFMDIYRLDANALRQYPLNSQAQYKQWTGSNAGPEFFTGPSSFGYTV